MGRVWRARDEVLRRDVAVKEVLLPETPSEDEANELPARTLREAQAAARLSHPNVVRIYDVLEADGRPWIVMEYIPSRSLAEVIKTDGPMRPDQVAVIGLAVLDALRAAHGAGVLHRDIKPGNVLLAEDGRVVLTDFGLATFDDIGSSLTQSGVVHGSPQFIAPERALDGTSSIEADMWSLGATLYAAVEGRAPYARGSAYQTLAALATSPPDPPKRAGTMRPVLAGLLRRKPASRMRADEVRARLTRVANGEAGRYRFAPRQRRPLGAEDVSSARVPPIRGVRTPTPPSGGAGVDDPAESLPQLGAPRAGRVDGSYRGAPLEWRNADGRIVAGPPDGTASTTGASNSGGTDGNGSDPKDSSAKDSNTKESTTKEDLAHPAGRRSRRVFGIVAVVVLLGGGDYLAARELGTAQQSVNHGQSTPGAVASSNRAPTSPVIPVLANVAWPCDQYAPSKATALPSFQATYGGRALSTNWTWFPFTPDFPIGLPVGWLVARSASTLCLYDQAGRPGNVGVDVSTPPAHASPSAVLNAYVATVRHTVGFSNLKIVDKVAPGDPVGPMTTATVSYSFSGTAGALFTWARVYELSGRAYIVSFTTDAASANVDETVFQALETSVIGAHLAPPSK
jgi:serine/threonine protein kinase